MMVNKLSIQNSKSNSKEAQDVCTNLVTMETKSKLVHQQELSKLQQDPAFFEKYDEKNNPCTKNQVFH